MTLEAILKALVDHHGWDGLGERIPVRCFNIDPSISSSLRFLRKTPWAREKVESLYLHMLRQQRQAQTPRPRPGGSARRAQCADVLENRLSTSTPATIRPMPM